MILERLKRIIAFRKNLFRLQIGSDFLSHMETSPSDIPDEYVSFDERICSLTSDDAIGSDYQHPHPMLSQRPKVDSWFRVCKRELSSEILEIHKANLTVRPHVPNYVTDAEPEPTVCYEETDEELLVPFYYGMVNFGTDFVDNRKTGMICREERNISFQGVLDEEVMKQVSASRAMLAALNSVYGTGLLALAPGMGKTTVALYLWSEICRMEGGIIPALVLAHKDFILDQWLERIRQFLPDARVGIMRRDVFDYEGKDIVICSIQSMITLVRDETSGERVPRYSQAILQRFGMLIIDVSDFFSSIPRNSHRSCSSHAGSASHQCTQV